jgi:4'-phosphopantetheinyl transferase
MTSATPWILTPPLPELPADAAHVWRAALDVDPAPFERVLSPEEREHAARFRFERGRERYTVARGVLRALLGAYLACAPQDLRFVYGARGKPALEPGVLEFNVAHSHDLALIAVARGRRVGVDVEAVRELSDAAQIARRFFSAAECAALSAVPAEQQLQAFFACWTRKEAFLKARGEGIAFGLDQFDVTLAPGEPARLLAVRDLRVPEGGTPGEAARWSLAALEPGPGFAGALAVEGPAAVACYEFAGG